MIAIRSIVRFIANNRDQSLSQDDEYYLVDVGDLELFDEQQHTKPR